MRHIFVLTLRRAEMLVYNGFIVPVVAYFPASFTYKVACIHGDMSWKFDKTTRGDVIRRMFAVFPNEYTQDELRRMSRDHLRQRSCELMDLSRLSIGDGERFGRLVEIRGLEHLNEALTRGKGAILYSAHYGSYIAAFALLGARGLPVTILGRWPSKIENRNSPVQLFFARLATGWHRVAHHLHRPNIQPRPGKIEVGLQVAKILRQNEVIVAFDDSVVFDPDRERAIWMDFLGRKALLMPGAIEIAKAVGTPMFMAFVTRRKDWRHQVLEISPPLDLSGDVPTIYRRCLRATEEVIRRDPAQWRWWREQALEQLGLVGVAPTLHADNEAGSPQKVSTVESKLSEA
jgi:KDO2-lipid IV(A) lauroyltransferase